MLNLHFETHLPCILVPLILTTTSSHSRPAVNRSFCGSRLHTPLAVAFPLERPGRSHGFLLQLKLLAGGAFPLIFDSREFGTVLEQGEKNTTHIGSRLVSSRHDGHDCSVTTVRSRTPVQGHFSKGPGGCSDEHNEP